MAEKRKFDLEERLIEFAVRVLKAVGALPQTREGKYVGGQLLRSGTSPAPKYGEAQAAESQKDFIHKMKIALKELRESMVWLKIISQSEMLPGGQMSEITKECDEQIAIFVSSIRTAQDKL